MCTRQQTNTLRVWFSFLVVIVAALTAPLAALAGGEAADPDAADYSLFLPVVRAGGDAADASLARIFPLNLAVTSPLHMEQVVSAAAVDGSWTTGYAIATAEIYEVLTGATPLTDVFDPAALLTVGADAACYGPTLLYRNHPDGGGSGSGELPRGDLGLWQEVDSTGDACAAAQINARLNGAEQQSQASLLLMAALIDAANDAGLPLPTTGGALDVTTALSAVGIPHVTFTLATISYDVSTDAWTYYAEFTYTDPADGSSHAMVVSLTYTPDAASPTTTYTGVMHYRANDEQAWGNCPGGGGSGATKAVTHNGTLAFARLGADDLRIQQRTGVFCGYDVDARTDGIVDPTGDWGDNYASFTANFNPATMAGDYAYAWQAGVHDRASRVLNVGINNFSPLDGETYFGYGDRVQAEADGVFVAQGMYCNWAGPGAASSLQPYAQRQFITFNSTTGHFDTPAGGSDLRYAPTNSCQYDGSGAFWYDRNLNGAEDETPDDVIVTPGAVNPFDLMEAIDSDGDGAATIAEKIAARGYHIPVAP